MKRGHSAQFFRRDPFDIEEQSFNALQSHTKVESRMEKPSFKATLDMKSPKLQELLNEIDTLMVKFSNKTNKLVLKSQPRSPLVDLDLYTMADVNIPDENSKIQCKTKDLTDLKKKDMSNEIYAATTNASSKKGSSFRNEENCRLKTGKLGHIEKLMVENWKCLNEKMVQVLKKQERDYKKEREILINYLMSFTSCFYSSIELEILIDIEANLKNMRDKQRILLGNASSNTLRFLIENAVFLLEEKEEILRKQQMKGVGISNLIKMRHRAKIFK